MHPTPPTQVTAGELFVQGIERKGRVSHFPGKAVGGPKSYDNTETVVLCIVYNILYSI
jgi:hypothetical protein